MIRHPPGPTLPDALVPYTTGLRSADDLVGVFAGLAHGVVRQMRFQPDRQTAIRLIVSVVQIGWRMWLIGDPVHQRGAERRHRLLRDDPGGDRRAETFAVEGTQRRRLPEQIGRAHV